MLFEEMQGIFAVIIFILQGIGTKGECFFPPEYRGEFVMQKSVNTGNAVEYSTINISYSETALWGTCWKRFDNNFIFTISTDQYSCWRCLDLQLKAKNVLQARTTNLSKCYVNEEAAIASCPSESVSKDEPLIEIILFKTRDQFWNTTLKEFCPIDERYSVVYASQRINRTSRCMLEETIVDMCPSASDMSLKFEKCNKDFEFNLTCIGQWKEKDGRHYLVLEDTRQKPTYRCALFEKDNTTGIVKIALGEDSTCDNGLVSATKGHETLVMTPAPQEDFPWLSETENEVCSFPTWMQGKWEHVIVEENNFVYREQTNFKKYDLRCLASEDENRYFVHVRTQCQNEKSYLCLWAQQRADNVFEFQFSANASLRRNERLCHKKNFGEDVWITQGRKEPINELKCPISGIFKGMIPEAGNYCSTLSSDCSTPDLMYYNVYDCNTLQIYEEREYRCLGHWKEKDQLYTYTKRTDKVANGTFECFVGSIVSDREDYIIIREAGEHCQRKMDEDAIGMKLTKQKQSKLCVESDDSTGSNTNIEFSTSRSRFPINVHSTTQRTIHGNSAPTSPTPSRANTPYFGTYTHMLSLIFTVVMVIFEQIISIDYYF